MTGFDLRWLDLREEPDQAARDVGLRTRAVEYLQATNSARIIDLGCGTGSTFRGMLPLARGWQWVLVDNDPHLLAEAMARHGSSGRIECVESDLACLAGELFEEARMVTASALFDLVSEAFLDNLVSVAAAGKVGLYSALNYDGRCEWDIPLPLDSAVIAAFNAHQRRDKGFGEALGPSAGQVLEDLLRTKEFSVFTAASPWKLGPSEAELQRQFIEGIARAVSETGILEKAAIDEWRHSRIALIDDARCEVGHWDLLALPN